MIFYEYQFSCDIKHLYLCTCDQREVGNITENFSEAVLYTYLSIMLVAKGKRKDLQSLWIGLSKT